MRRLAYLLAAGVAAACALACGDDRSGGGRGAGADAAPDPEQPSADAGPTGQDPDLPAWEPGLPPSSEMQGRRGLVPLRGIIHLHSPYSWDACDGAPRGDDGAPDQACLQDLRGALCATRMDFAALTDHDDSMADEPWGPDLFLASEGDRVIEGDAGPIANAIPCPDGHEVLVTVGGENDLMPIMLDRHPDGDAQARHDAYNASDAAAVATFRSLGGLAWVAHSESKDLDALTALEVDGMEIFNLHAAIDPDIRVEWLGLDGPEVLTRALEFADLDPAGPEPDLAILAFMEPHTVSLAKWDALLAAGQRVVASAGTDAHQNALPFAFRDGERGDSYRRTMRWFSNVVLVADGGAGDPAQVEQSLADGRGFVAFEVLGTPVGFDLRAERAEGGPVEMGGEVSVADGATIVATTPSVAGLADSVPAPEIHTSILRVDQEGSQEIASGDGEVSASADRPGAYRVEVRITPHHLAPYLGSLGPGYAEREAVWIYSNPIYVVP